MATLKISDLSVGDWVRYDGKEYQVQCVDGLSEIVTLFGYCEQREESAGNLRSIPITAEILEKNGFVKSDDFLHKIDLPDNILLGVRRQSDGYIFELKREKRRIGELLVIIRGIRYIHDLQHALRLAEVDKEINL